MTVCLEAVYLTACATKWGVWCSAVQLFEHRPIQSAPGLAIMKYRGATPRGALSHMDQEGGNVTHLSRCLLLQVNVSLEVFEKAIGISKDS